MMKYTVKVDGMQCGMCEAHVNDAIRKAFEVKKVRSSHTKKQAVVITENAISEQALRDAINNTGYTALEVTSEPYAKSGPFSFFKR